MEKADWGELILRLERDISTRDSGTTNPVAGDSDAWRLADESLHRMARAITSRYPDFYPEDLDDLVQSVLFKLQSGQFLRRIRATKTPEGFLYVVLRNAALNVIRHRQYMMKSVRSVGLTDESVTRGVPPVHAQQLENYSLLREMLQSLKPIDSRILKMRFFQEMSISDISRILGMSYSQVATRLFRTLKNLRTRVASDPDVS